MISKTLSDIQISIVTEEMHSRVFIIVGLLESERVHIIRLSRDFVSVGASLKSIPARSLLSAFPSLSFASLSSSLFPYHPHPRRATEREGGGTGVGVAPSYVSGLACEAKDEVAGGDQDEKERESRRERKGTRKTKVRESDRGKG